MCAQKYLSRNKELTKENFFLSKDHTFYLLKIYTFKINWG